MLRSNSKNEVPAVHEKAASMQSRSLLDFMTDKSVAMAPIVCGDQLLGDLVLENSLVVISGDNTEANSFLATWIGLTVAGRWSTDGMEKGAGVPVLYLNGRCTASDFWHRLEGILGKGPRSTAPKKDFHVLSSEDYPATQGYFLDETAGQYVIQNDLARIRKDKTWKEPALLLIVDDSFSWVGGGPTYSASTMRFVSWLRKAQQRNIAVIVIEPDSNVRDNKGDSVLHRAADMAIRVHSMSTSIVKPPQIADAPTRKSEAKGDVGTNTVSETVLKFSASKLKSAESPSEGQSDYQLTLRQDTQTFRVSSEIVKTLNKDDMKTRKLRKAFELITDSNLTLEQAGEHPEVMMLASAISKGFKALGLKVPNGPGRRASRARMD